MGESELGIDRRKAAPRAPFGLAVAAMVPLRAPVIRDAPACWKHPYAEPGTGVDVDMPAWKTDKRRFGGDFDFGDPVGLRRKVGDEGRDEIVPRAEHDADGGIRRPNPGEDGFRLRDMHRF
jgi:hypothetical protein